MARWMPSQTLVAGLGNPLYALAAFGKNAYFMYIDGSDNMVFMKSTNEGQTWSSGTTVASGISDVPLDRSFIADGSNLYVAYIKNVGSGSQPCSLYFRRSTDSGATWSSETTLDNGVAHGTNRFMRVCMAADGAGNVYMGYASISETDFTTDGLYFRKSTDSGATWGSATQPFSANAISPSRPDIAVLGSTVHLTWTDARFGSLYTGNPGETYYGRSTNGGSSWTETRMTTTANSWGSGSTLRPIICADQQNHVTLVWQDPSNTPGSEDLYYTYSADGGLTWAANSLLVSNTNTQEHAYLAASGNAVNLLWADDRSGTKQTYSRTSRTFGTSFAAEEIPQATTGAAAAPRSVFSDNMIIGVINDASNGNLICIRNPIFLKEPDVTRVLDNCTRANQGPAPSASWTNGLITSTAGEGLVVLSNKITRKSSGSFRQGSYWNTAMASAAHETWITVAGAIGTNSDGCTLWARVTNPGGGATFSGYGIDIINSSGSVLWNLWRQDGTTTTTILNSFLTQALAAGDKIGLQVIGSAIYSWYWETGGSGWRLVSNYIDSTYSSGSFIGLEALNNQDFSISAFGGGTDIPAAGLWNLSI